YAADCAWLVEAEMPCSLRGECQLDRAERVAILEEEGEANVCVPITDVEQARGFVARDTVRGLRRQECVRPKPSLLPCVPFDPPDGERQLDVAALRSGPFRSGICLRSPS